MARHYFRSDEKMDYVESVVLDHAETMFERFGMLVYLTPGQIAELCSYSNSSQFRETLYTMADQGKLIMITMNNNTPVSDFKCAFFHPEYAPRKLI